MAVCAEQEQLALDGHGVMVSPCGCLSLWFLLSCIPVTFFCLLGPLVVSGCHVILLLCLVQEVLHANAITTMPSQQQDQFHNQPEMNHDKDAITTRTTST